MPVARFRRGLTMKAAAVLAVAVLGMLTQPRSPAAEPASKVYELRIYTAAPGKLDNVVARFRDHTCKLFEKHGMTNVGYWTATPDDGKLYYILAHVSRSAADQSWKAFIADPEWKDVVKQTEANGKIVAKVDKWYLTATDYSPPVKAPAGEHVYELRTYTASPGKLDALNARFRDHTMKLFEKHGMTNVGYWNPIKGEKGADNTLVYLLADKDMDAAKKSWAAFRTDPDWVAARKESEEKAGGSLTVTDGVKSVYMKPTDFSAMK
jgi:NIPSNAP